MGIGSPRQSYIGNPMYKGNFADSELTPYTWRKIFRHPLQSNIANDTATFYLPLNDAAPNTSITDGAVTLNKSGAGTSSQVSQNFNQSQASVYYDGSCVHAANYGAGYNIGTQDILVECDFCILGTFGNFIGMFACDDNTANNGWDMQLYVVDASQYAIFRLKSGGSEKFIWFTLPSKMMGGWHRLKIGIDRDNNANSSCYIDGVSLGATAYSTITDYSATSITGTYFRVGSRCGSANNMTGYLSQIKVKYGVYTGSTTADFDKGLTSTFGGTNLTYTRSGMQTGENYKLSPSGLYLHESMANNPQYCIPDSSYPYREGILMEHESTNYASYSNEFNDASWTKTNVTVTQNQGVNRQGAINVADNLTSTLANGTVEKTTALPTTSRKLIFAVDLEATTGTFTDSDVVLEIEDSAAGAEKASMLLDFDTGATASVPTSKKRCFVHQTFSAGVGGNARIRIKMITNALTIRASNVQVGAFNCIKPFCYVPTLTGNGSRGLTFLYLNPSEVNVAQGTIICLWIPYFASTDWHGSQSICPFSFEDTATNVFMSYFTTSATPQLNLTYFGQFYTNTTPKSWTQKELICWGGQWDTIGNKYRAIWKGIQEPEQTTAIGYTPVVNDARIGNNTHDYAGCQGIIVETRLFKSYLTQGEIAEHCNEMIAEAMRTI